VGSDSVEYKVFVGDNVDVLRREIEDSSIQLTVTSPPYDNLRAYNGFDWNFHAISRELYRVTKPGGVVVWVVGDATIRGSETGTSFRQALGFMDIGFNLHDTMIYAKTNPIPQTHNRYEQQFEYMFVLSKGKPSVFNPLKAATKHGGKLEEWGKRRAVADNAARRRRNGSDTRITSKEKPLYNIWFYSVGGGNAKHPGVFPEALARDHILSWSNAGDTVLDPFLGSGTTGKMALLEGRNFIGCDISPEYVSIAEKRLEEARLTELRFCDGKAMHGEAGLQRKNNL
jgi:site-specific DNA-methyltransferase (adenine-specific)